VGQTHHFSILLHPYYTCTHIQQAHGRLHLYKYIVCCWTCVNKTCRRHSVHRYPCPSHNFTAAVTTKSTGHDNTTVSCRGLAYRCPVPIMFILVRCKAMVLSLNCR
jgi:hypothetical protein